MAESLTPEGLYEEIKQNGGDDFEVMQREIEKGFPFLSLISIAASKRGINLESIENFKGAENMVDEYLKKI